jgi:peroxiredoxin
VVLNGCHKHVHVSIFPSADVVLCDVHYQVQQLATQQMRLRAHKPVVLQQQTPTAKSKALQHLALLQVVFPSHPP